MPQIILPQGIQYTKTDKVKCVAEFFFRQITTRMFQRTCVMCLHKPTHDSVRQRQSDILAHNTEVIVQLTQKK